MRKDGLFPQAFSGGRAVVFPVIIEGRKYAIKCWIQSLGALEERYQAISRLIQNSKPSYLIDSIYRQKELLFNGIRYPVLQMEWSESRTLKQWISAHINDSSRLSALAERFLEVVADMHAINMSHGDLQHENILVSDDSAITLVDYDSIYLNGLDHLDDEVKVLPGFQHQSRSCQVKASPKSDYLSEYVIYTTLVALSKKPDLWKHAQDHNRLLFSKEDLSNPSGSVLFQDLKKIVGLSDLIDAFQSQCLCSELNNIISTESIISLPKSSSHPKIKRQATRVQASTATKSASGSARDLRKATIWAGSQDSTSEWIFGRSNKMTQADNPSIAHNDTSSEQEVKSESTARDSSGIHRPARTSPHNVSTDNCDNYTTDATSSSSKQYPCLATPDHSLQGSLGGLSISRMDLVSISIEDYWLRLICSDSGGVPNGFIVFKSSLLGLRSVGNKLELVTSNAYGSADVLTISAPDPSGGDSISNIIYKLKTSGIDTASPSECSATSQIPDPTDKDPTSSVDKSKDINVNTTQGSESESRASTGRPFAYATVDDIAYCTGQQHHVVQSVANNLRVNPPFTRIEADRIAGLLLGDHSIRRAYDKRYSSSNSDMSQPRPHEGAASAASASNRKQELKTSSSSEWQAFQSSAPFSEGRKFSYSSVDDIAYCTAKQPDQVRSAAKKLRALPPFTLIEADRIAGLLLGDPSIRRAFMKTTSSQHSGMQGSYDQSSSIKASAMQTGANPISVTNKGTEPQSLDAQNLTNTNSSSYSGAVLSKDVSKRECFVATAIYETEYHPDLATLRNYRDRVLLSTRLGSHLVTFYYKVGPVIAQVIVRAKLASKLRPVMSFVIRHLSAGK